MKFRNLNSESTTLKSIKKGEKISFLTSNNKISSNKNKPGKNKISEIESELFEVFKCFDNIFLHIRGELIVV